MFLEFVIPMRQTMLFSSHHKHIQKLFKVEICLGKASSNSKKGQKEKDDIQQWIHVSGCDAADAKVFCVVVFRPWLNYCR